MALRGTQFIETDALMLALEENEIELDEHLKQLHPSELRNLQYACGVLSEACRREIRQQEDFE